MRKATMLFAGVLFFLASQAMAAQKIVSFEPAFRGAAMARSVENAGGKVVRQFTLIDAVVATFPDNVRNTDIASVRGVTSVEEDAVINWIESAPVSMDSLPLPSVTDIFSSIKSGSVLDIPAAPEARPAAAEGEIPWGVKRVNASGAWNFTEGAGVKVAVIDTGIDFTHPDLAANYAGGYNTIITTQPPLDDQGHGTHVAGTIAAVRNGTGVIGVAPKARLYAVKVLDKSGSGAYSNVMAGIEWAAKNGMQVINMSLGGGGYMEAMHNMVKAAYDAGVAVVCAAGNDSGAVNYPAKYPEAIAVSASDSSDKLASFSSRGKELAIIAPGVDIYSTKMGGGYRNMSGTSMACPHAAGLAALAVGAGASTPDAVRAALTKAAVLLPGLTAAQQGAGMVNAASLR